MTRDFALSFISSWRSIQTCTRNVFPRRIGFKHGERTFHRTIDLRSAPWSEGFGWSLRLAVFRALGANIIILDEFQRFKHLLDGTDRAGDLARELFNFGDARVLLLSATPYKMYTMADEAESDDHFLATSCKRSHSYRRMVGEVKDSENRSRLTGTVSLQPLPAEDTKELVEGQSRELRRSCVSSWSERNDLP